MIKFRKVLDFGKVDYYGNNRRSNAVSIEVELKEKEGKGLCLSICGNIWNSRKSDILSGGQNIDEIASILKSNKKVQRIKEIWKKYHLNDMNAGCIHQDSWDVAKEVDMYGKIERAGWIRQSEHAEGLLCKACPECGYKYASAWLFREIPSEIIEEIKSW